MPAELVDAKNGVIMELYPDRNEIASKLKTFMEAKPNKVYFNKKRYAEFEDFQFVASFYGITCKTFDPKFVEINGFKGFHAKAMLLDDKLNEVGRAEAYCMDDEPNWKYKPIFQLASMAQTRAAAKAFANRFRPITRLAGLEGTPYEEIDAQVPPAIDKPRSPGYPPKTASLAPSTPILEPTPEEIDTAEEVMTDSVAAKPGPDELEHIKDEIPFDDPPEEAKIKKVSQKQSGLLYVKAKQAGISDAMRKAYLKDNFQVEHFADLPWTAMAPVLVWIAGYKESGSPA